MSGNERFCGQSQLRVLVVFSVLLVVFSTQVHAADLRKQVEPKTLSESLPGNRSSIETAASATPDVTSPEKPIAEVQVISSRLASYQQPIGEVASNVTYIGKEDLNWRRPLTFQEAVKESEGAVLYDQVGNGIDTVFSLRGFNRSSDVIFLLDGVRLNEVDGGAVNYSLIAMSDMESVQIERGSASPIYGSGAFGGVVNLTSRRPSAKPFSLFGGLEWATHQGLRFNKGVSGTIQDHLTPLGGKWTYYFNGGRDVNDGFRDSGEWRISSFDFKTAYELPEEQGKIHVGVKHLSDEVSNPGEITFEQFQGIQERTNKPFDGRKLKSTIVQGGVDKKFLDNRLTTSFLASTRLNSINSFTTSTQFADGNGFDPDTNFVTLNSRDNNYTGQLTYRDQWQELGHETLVGMEFQDAANVQTQRDAFGGQIVTTTATERDRVAAPENTALFWRETLRFFDRVIPYFGMRHDINRLRVEDHVTSANSMTRRWRKTTLSTGLTVKALKFMDLFGNYSQGFRSPGPDNLSGVANNILLPETSDSYELGARFWCYDYWATKLSYFLIDVKDEITFDGTAITAATPWGRNVNIAKSRRYGLELREDLKPVRELSFFGAYAWTRAYVAETAEGASLVNDRSLAQIPEHRLSLGAFAEPLIRFGDPFKGVKLGLSGTFTGRQHPTDYESSDQPTLDATGGAGHWIKAYSVWDFIMSFTWRENEIYFKVNNLFDEKYYSRAVSSTIFSSGTYAPGTYTFVNPGAPREFVLGSRWEF